MPHNLHTIRERSSVRTYSDKKIEPAKGNQLADYIEGNSVGPFGTEIRLIIADILSPTRTVFKIHKVCTLCPRLL